MSFLIRAAIRGGAGVARRVWGPAAGDVVERLDLANRHAAAVERHAMSQQMASDAVAADAVDTGTDDTGSDDDDGGWFESVVEWLLGE
ncbi:hypothetical protein ACQEV2_00980 [Streptomyces sp. CA-251387]|uniref:hypothetical protein n=1 Tax=Streptomyces sp. CA-251387 TaxID=3240064 RepID=UPI003D9456BE